MSINIKKFFKNKSLIFIVLIIVVIAGFFGFLSYRDKIFSKEILRLEILGPENAQAGDEITYTVNYKNNSNFTLQKPKLIFKLPDNSLTEDSKLRLSQDLEDIYPGEDKFVQFKARLLGKEEDLKVAQVWLSYIPKNLSARYESDTTFTSKIVTVPIALSFDLPPTIQKGAEITYTVNYSSNIDYPLENLSIKIDPVSGFNFEGADPASLDNIEWRLPTLQKGQGGKITIKGVMADGAASQNFSAHLGMWQDSSFIVIKEATQDVQIIGSVPGSSPPPGPQVVTMPSSHVAVIQKAYYSGNQDFKNSGPIPPKAGTPTSYTITWQVTNDINNVNNVTVSALLPQNVTLTAVLPESQIPNVSLNNQTHQIVWSVGSVPAGTGASSSPPTISFQVTLTPSSSQKGILADLIGQATVSGQDQVTGATVQSTASAVNTSLPDDQSNSGGGIVQ